MCFRKLRANEIDCRVATVTEKGCSLLLYKDARVDQNILDETYGQFRWQRSHQVIDGNLYCTVSIKDDYGEWVSKQDVGVESYTEKEKGQASDSFKRACFNWGIGRELYTAPFIWVPRDKANIYEYNGKYTTKERFIVSEIGYDDAGSINRLTVCKKNGEVVYTFGSEPIRTAKEIRQESMRSLLISNGIAPDWVCKMYNIKELDALKTSQAEAITNNIQKFKVEFEKAKASGEWG